MNIPDSSTKEDSDVFNDTKAYLEKIAKIA